MVSISLYTFPSCWIYKDNKTINHCIYLLIGSVFAGTEFFSSKLENENWPWICILDPKLIHLCTFINVLFLFASIRNISLYHFARQGDSIIHKKHQNIDLMFFQQNYSLYYTLLTHDKNYHANVLILEPISTKSSTNLI